MVYTGYVHGIREIFLCTEYNMFRWNVSVYMYMYSPWRPWRLGDPDEASPKMREVSLTPTPFQLRAL